MATFNSDFPEDHSGTTDFYGASPKAEEAWRNLMKPYLVRISGQEASRLSRPTSQISRDPDYYITSLDVYHQLHCLNDIRKMGHLNLVRNNFCELRWSMPCSDMGSNSDGSGITNNPVAWPNGKASDYESEDSGFDPQRDQFFLLPL
ncbi:hypothetical protein FDENT_1358 [Fusarium denticulatum]|uniref:Uncharacterized protein n=1 Tax=Fusarium denticulatum TaxID=48507 RepID=A0A8H5XIC2_9HYPO|nr:hypothetical protein FDENT_1358 [Fusarium denticulatum]